MEDTPAKSNSAAQKSAALMLSLTALITICFAPAMAQQKDQSYDNTQPHRAIAVSYLA